MNLWKIQVAIFGQSRKIQQVIEASGEDEAAKIAKDVALGRGFEFWRIKTIQVTKLHKPNKLEY